MELALNTQFSNECTAWERRRNEITQRFKGTLSQRQVEMHGILEKNFEDIRLNLREAVIVEVLKSFP